MTTLGETWFVIVAGIVLVVVDHLRTPTRWVAAYVALVILGQNVLTRTIKELADRVRPGSQPDRGDARAVVPERPLGDRRSVLGGCRARARTRTHAAGPRDPCCGGAVGIAVAVAGSRVLLDVHWLSDVIAGVCLGWAWFAVCSVAFGGRVLRFGRAAERVEKAARAESRAAGALAAP